MFRLFISSKNDPVARARTKEVSSCKNTITKYNKRKNINYEIVDRNHIYQYGAIIMTNGKIDLYTNNDIFSKYVLFIYYDKLVAVAKFCTKNKLTVKFGDISNVAHHLLRDKIFEDLSYLYKHKFLTKNTISYFIECACKEFDDEVLDYLLDFGIKIEHLGRLVEHICCRKNINTQMVKMLLNHCRKKYSRRLYSFPTCPYGDKVNTIMKNMCMRMNCNIVLT